MTRSRNSAKRGPVSHSTMSDPTANRQRPCYRKTDVEVIQPKVFVSRWRMALWLSGVVVHMTAYAAPPGHYLFAWAGDIAQQGDDFLAVIDADPASSSYG